MESDSVRNAHEAQAALNAIAGAKASAADRLTSPWWYHPILGLLAAVFVVSYTIGGVWVMLTVSVVYFAGLGILMGTYRKKTGMWINGLQAGKASWWTLPLVVIMIASMGGAYYLHAERGLDWPAWVAGIIVFVAVNIFGRLFDVALRSQLRQKP
ncbi:hypothetical protein AS189_06360 [Arthrobacter alpinus]|uniref:Uncharacterized protein n=1 Tax=Arthrobacter alpinus TaxID=656366 RepID=A0A0S2LXD3_9MICC|nr:hypothetical protein [Arthrobacter alpinus]ALO66185.1 hypothetical protein AS189_06360 [Arthrobacter alpinus]